MDDPAITLSIQADNSAPVSCADAESVCDVAVARNGKVEFTVVPKVNQSNPVVEGAIEHVMVELIVRESSNSGCQRDSTTFRDAGESTGFIDTEEASHDTFS